MNALFLDALATPLGPALLVFDAAGRVRAMEWEDGAARLLRSLRRFWGWGSLPPRAAMPGAVAAGFAAYFDGGLTALEGLAVATGGTAFQRAHWAALRGIPAGTTTTYAALAAAGGRATAVRATGAANGANPVSIAIPCHRVLGADGRLTGYGGGLYRKAWLLRHEGVSGWDPESFRPGR